MTHMRLLWAFRRLLGGLLVVLLGLFMAGCGAEPPESPTESEQQNAEGADAEDDGADAQLDEGARDSVDMDAAPDVSDEVWAADGAIGPGEYANMLDQGTYKLYWSSTESTIRLGIEVATEGWVAIGIQPGQRMKDSDIILGLVENGEVSVIDSYSSGDYGPHKADVEFGGTDDVASFAGNEAGGVTVVEFERALDTGDDYDIALEPGVAVGIIWAYGSSDIESMRHSTRGYGEIVP